ncbi:MAG: SIMPL domain-containing protein [Chloroflexaceae bacterium]
MLTIFGAVITLLLIAILVIVAGQSLTGAAQAQPAGVTGARQVTVVGRGEAKGTPDTGYVQIGVETEANTTEEALEQNNAQVAAIIEKIKQLGVAEEDIQTSNFSINTRYDNDGRRVVGYQVSNIVSVTIRNLEQTGTLLDQVVQVGANRVYGINFGVDDPSELLAQARDKAVADARSKAEQLAQASSASVGQVLVITENVGSQSPIPMPMRSEIAEEDAAAVPIQTGRQTVSTQVQVTFELQ